MEFNEEMKENHLNELQEMGITEEKFDEQLERFEKESNFRKLEVSTEILKSNTLKWIELEGLGIKGIKKFRKEKAVNLFEYGLELFLIGKTPTVPLIQSLLLDKKAVKEQASLVEGWSDDFDDYLEVLRKLENDLGITGNELDDFFKEIEGVN